MKKVYEWKVYEFNEEQPSNVFFAKPNGKCIQPNKKVVLLTHNYSVFFLDSCFLGSGSRF